MWKLRAVWIAGVVVLLMLSTVPLWRLRDHASGGDPRLSAGVRVGDRMPALSGETPTGGRVSMSWGQDGRPSLLYVMRTTSGWVARNEESARVLESCVRGRYRVVRILLDRPRGATPAGITSEALVILDATEVGRLRLGATPQTIVVDPRGYVDRIWTGAFQGDIKRAVEAYFGVTLPLLSQLPGSSRACPSPEGPYSPGFVKTMDGVRQRCGEDGRWHPASTR